MFKLNPGARVLESLQGAWPAAGWYDQKSQRNLGWFSWVDMSFPEPLEYSYVRLYKDKAAACKRLCLLYLSTLLLISLLLDYFILHHGRQEIWNARLPCLIVFLSLFLLSYSYVFKYLLSLSALVTLSCVLLTFLSLSVQSLSELTYFYAGIMGPLLIFVLYSSNIAFKSSLVIMVSSLIFCAAYWALYLEQASSAQHLVLNVLLLFNTLSSLVFLYILESSRRQQFFLSQQSEFLKFTAHELEENHDRFSCLVALDPVTGVANRKSFERNIKLEWARGVRKKYSISMLLIDCVELSELRAKQGEKEANTHLVRISDLLKAYARRPGDIVARYDENSLVVLLSDTQLKNARHIAAKVIEQVHQLLEQVEETEFKDFTIRIGVSCMQPMLTNFPSDLVALSEKGLKMAKQQKMKMASP